MLRLLHTADWQIGRQFSSLDPEHAPILADARLAAVERLATLAVAHRVDAVLVAGDVFDAQTVSERTLRRCFNAMAGYTGPWLLLPGNHDAALAESVWSRVRRLGLVPPNVHLLLAPEPLVMAELRLTVLPAPLTQRHTYADLTEWFDQAASPDDHWRVGLAHGSVQGLLAEDIDSPNPIAPDRPQRARLDYLALGDWHGQRLLGPRMAYSGTPEPDRFKANGSGQALLVELPAPGAEPRLQPLATAQYRWQTLEAALQVDSDLDLLLRQLDTLGPQDVVELRLQGQLDLQAHARLSDGLARAAARARHLQTDQGALRLSPTDDDLSRLQADGYLGEVLAELRAVPPDDPGARTAQDALALLASLLMARQGPEVAA